MDEDFKPGDLVFLTQAYEVYWRKKQPLIKIRLVNRLAKLEEILDWDSEKGRKIMEARKKSGKWEGLPIEDNKYIFSVYYHDVTGRKGEKGVIDRGVPMFSKDPKTKEPFFVKAPEWLFREIAKQCERFDIKMEGN